jgi:peroxiredoxin
MRLAVCAHSGPVLLLLAAAPVLGDERVGELLRIAPGREWTYEGNCRYADLEGGVPFEARHAFRLRYFAFDRTAEGATRFVVQRRIESGQWRSGKEEGKTDSREDLFFMEIDGGSWQTDVVKGSASHVGTSFLTLSPFPPAAIPSKAGSKWRREADRSLLSEADGEPVKLEEDLGGWMPEVTEVSWTVESIEGGLLIRGRHVPTGTEADQPSAQGLRYSASYRIDRATGAVTAVETSTSRVDGTAFQASLRLLETREVSAEELEARRSEAEAWRKLTGGTLWSERVNEAWETRLRDLRRQVAETARRIPTPRFPEAATLVLETIENGEQAARFLSRSSATREQLLGHPAPDFIANDLDGKAVTLSGLRGQVVILSFGSAGSAWSRTEARLLSALAGRWGPKGLVIVSLWPEERREAATLARESGIAHVVLPARSETFRAYGIESPGWILFLDRKGAVRVIRSSVVMDGEDPEPWHRIVEALIEGKDLPEKLPSRFTR